MQLVVEVPDCTEIKKAEHVEVFRGKTARGTTLWINIDGICRLRIYGIDLLDLSTVEEANAVPGNTDS